MSRDVWEFETSGYKVVQEWILRRLARPRGRTSSELDKIRPIEWSVTIQRELLQILHIVEEFVADLTPRAQELLEQICASELIATDELPSPSDRETRSPRTR